MAAQGVKVLIVDDSPDIAELLKLSIDRESDMQSVGCLADADRLLVEVERLRPDIALIDLTMPNKDPIEVIREMARAFPETRAVIFSGYDDRNAIDRAFEAGAWGFVSKHEDMQKLCETIRQVARGELAIR